MKHKHYENIYKHHEIICAKAANMNLVVFCRDAYHNEPWEETQQLPMVSELEYFLCLPQHKESCLHWLNGGKIQSKFNGWVDITDKPDERTLNWSDRSVFMLEVCESRIKSRKEKRWIGVVKYQHTKDGNCYYINTQHSYETIEELKRDVYAPHGFDGWQFIEIEIEIEIE